MAIKSVRFSRLRRRSKSSSAKSKKEEVSAASTSENLNNVLEERGEIEETRDDESSSFTRFFNGASSAISGAFSEVTSMAEDMGTIIAYDEDDETKVEEKAVVQTFNEVETQDQKQGGLFSGVFTEVSNMAEDVGTIIAYDEDNDTIRGEETSVTQAETNEHNMNTAFQSGGNVDEASVDTTGLLENDRTLVMLNKELVKEEAKLKKIGDAYTKAEQDVASTKAKISALYEKIRLEDLIDEDVVVEEADEVDYGRKIGDAFKSGTGHVLEFGNHIGTAAHESGDRVLRFSSTMENAVNDAIFPHGV